jgi:uncharacterized 2Fe-2S/4Fe-4S cluster protein (DUF4445 family)
MTPTPRDQGWIKRVHPVILPPSLKDNTADVDRLIKGLKKTLQTEKVGMDLSLMKQIPHVLREFHYRVDCILYDADGSWDMIDLCPSSAMGPLYGLAVDLGTSTVVLRLLDLTTGEAKGETTFLNPQIEIGPDILTRIHYAHEGNGLDRLQTLLIEKLNRETTALTQSAGLGPTHIMGMSVAGNTTMTHLFLGLDPYWVCREPYIPVINSPGIIKAKDIGLVIHKEAPVLVLPSVGSYLGGDLIAGILASGLYREKDISILVDVGTNAEVVLGNQEWLMACAGAAGPALEGGVARMGMMAGPGVIDKVAIEPGSGDFQIRTIDNTPPIGICGSGLIDLVAHLFLKGMIDMRGKYVPERCGERLRLEDGIPHLIIVYSEDSGTGHALTLSQPDIDTLLRSKAAMYTILTTITHMVSLSPKEISRFHIAGTFGAFIDPQSAITLGMIPDLPIETYMSVGNTSLEGAGLALLNAQARIDTYEIRDRITYIELNVNQAFMNQFSAAKFIPHTDGTLFPSIVPVTP